MSTISSIARVGPFTGWLDGGVRLSMMERFSRQMPAVVARQTMWRSSCGARERTLAYTCPQPVGRHARRDSATTYFGAKSSAVAWRWPKNCRGGAGSRACAERPWSEAKRRVLMEEAVDRSTLSNSPPLSGQSRSGDLGHGWRPAAFCAGRPGRWPSVVQGSQSAGGVCGCRGRPCRRTRPAQPSVLQ